MRSNFSYQPPQSPSQLSSFEHTPPPLMHSTTTRNLRPAVRGDKANSHTPLLTNRVSVETGKLHDSSSSSSSPSSSSSLLSDFCLSCLGPRSSVLFLFTLCQILIFFDRGMVAGFLPSVQAELGGLTDTEAGLLGSGFIFGYMLACPMFAFFSKTVSPYKLMALGLFLWICATGACTITVDFLPLLIARIVTGVGEASFAGLAPTCIDDVAPIAHRTIWLSVFFSGIPLGSAAGYIAGGYFAKVGWHLGFMFEAAAMIPLVCIVFFWNDESNETKPTSSKRKTRAHQPVRRTNSWARIPNLAAVDQPAQRNNRAGYGSLDAADQYTEPALTPHNDLSPNSGGGMFGRSISTPALHRLHDGTLNPVPPVVGSARADSFGEDEKHSGPIVGTSTSLLHHPPASPSLGGRTTPTHTTPTSSARRLTRTPKPMDRRYIVPDPANPFHAPGGKVAAAATPTSTNNYDSEHVDFSYGPPPSSSPVDDGRLLRSQISQHSPLLTSPDVDSDSSYSRRQRALPSPGSFHPHYAAAERKRRVLARAKIDANEAAAVTDTSRIGGDDMFVTDILTLLTDGVYIVVVLGYAALAFVIGALSFWGPVDFSKTLNIGLGRSTRMIGAITFCCGLGGTFFGGWCLDYRGGSKGIFAVISALEICCVFTTISIGFALAAVLAVDLTTCMVCLALADFFLFATGAPVNASLLSVAPKNMRSLAMAMSILLMHALGDLPSPFLMGLITDEVGSIRTAMICLVLWLLWTVLFWAFGVKLARRRADAFRRQLEHDMSIPPNRQEQRDAERRDNLARRGSTGGLYAGDTMHSLHARPAMHRPYQYYESTDEVHQPYTQSAYAAQEVEPADLTRHQQQFDRHYRQSRSHDRTPPHRAREIFQPHHAQSHSHLPLTTTIQVGPTVHGLPIYDDNGRVIGYAVQTNVNNNTETSMPYATPAEATPRMTPTVLPPSHTLKEAKLNSDWESVQR